MNKTTLSLICLLMLTGPVAAEDPPSEEPNRDQVIHSVEMRKETLFNQYQQDKERLAQEYDAAIIKLAEEKPADYAKQKMLLEKKFKSEKKKMLRTFRSDNMKLEKRSANLRGHSEKYDVQSNARRRLDKSRHLEPIVGTRKKPIKRGPRGYVKESQRTQNSRTGNQRHNFTNDRILEMRNRSQSIMNKGSNR